MCTDDKSVHGTDCQTLVSLGRPVLDATSSFPRLPVTAVCGLATGPQLLRHSDRHSSVIAPRLHASPDCLSCSGCRRCMLHVSTRCERIDTGPLLSICDDQHEGPILWRAQGWQKPCDDDPAQGKGEIEFNYGDFVKSWQNTNSDLAESGTK